MNVTLIYLLLRLVQSDTNENNMNVVYTGITYRRSNFTYTNTLTQTESIMRIQIVFP